MQSGLALFFHKSQCFVTDFLIEILLQQKVKPGDRAKLVHLPLCCCGVLQYWRLHEVELLGPRAVPYRIRNDFTAAKSNKKRIKEKKQENYMKMLVFCWRMQEVSSNVQTQNESSTLTSGTKRSVCSERKAWWRCFDEQQYGLPARLCCFDEQPSTWPSSPCSSSQFCRRPGCRSWPTTGTSRTGLSCGPSLPAPACRHPGAQDALPAAPKCYFFLPQEWPFCARKPKPSTTTWWQLSPDSWHGAIATAWTWQPCAAAGRCSHTRTSCHKNEHVSN